MRAYVSNYFHDLLFKHSFHNDLNHTNKAKPFRRTLYYTGLFMRESYNNNCGKWILAIDNVLVGTQ